MACETNIIVAREVFYLYSTQHYGFASAPILSFLLILLCIIALRALGPVNHPNRSVDASENICFQKKMDITLILGFIFALLFWFFHFEKYLFLEALVYLLVALTSFIGKQKNSRKC